MADLLTDDLKNTIQGAYKGWLVANEFRPRKAQREMIGFIARSLSSSQPRLGVVEAGTGTGKTVAYCISAIPIAQLMGKKLIISTATVNLQEQVFLKDLPDVQHKAGLDFSYNLVKGRGRYLCLKRLDEYLRTNAQDEIPFMEELNLEQVDLYQEMLNRFSAGKWDGELDSWQGGLESVDWKPVTNDHRGCTNSRCSFFHQCPFFRARNDLDKSDVIVANHDLLLSDLALGGGAILSPPESSIYVIDEAHHLSEKTRTHFTLSAGVNGTVQWVDTVNSALGTMTQQLSRPDELVRLAASIGADSQLIQVCFEEVGVFLETLDFDLKEEAKSIHRFRHGEIPRDLVKPLGKVLPNVLSLSNVIGNIYDLLQDAVNGDLESIKPADAGTWLGPVGALHARSLSLAALIQDYVSDDSSRPVCARWISQDRSYFEMFSAPIEPGQIINKLLWGECYGAICTSATLTVRGQFKRFMTHVGLDGSINHLQLSSAFNYSELATFNVPRLGADPRDFDSHTNEIASLLPSLLSGEVSALILFSSWRQLNGVMKILPDSLTEQCLVQGDYAKQILIASHREKVLKGRPSFLVGLASFSEGLDLPGDFCRHVIIAKIPFSVPDDPVDQAVAEWVESQGKNAFYEISVPDAVLKLVQACGRLIRNEQDFGKITLLDRRIVSQSYGQILLDSLPPYRKVIER